MTTTISAIPLTDAEKAFIESNYCRMTTKVMADHLGRNYHSLKGYLFRNGMTRGKAAGNYSYAERNGLWKHSEEMFAQSMAGRKFENASIKPAQPEFIAVMNAKAIERRYSIPEYSGCGSSSVIAMEAA